MAKSIQRAMGYKIPPFQSVKKSTEKIVLFALQHISERASRAHRYIKSVKKLMLSPPLPQK